MSKLMVSHGCLDQRHKETGVDLLHCAMLGFAVLCCAVLLQGSWRQGLRC